MSVRILTVPFDPTNEVFHDDGLNQFLVNKHLVSMKQLSFNLMKNCKFRLERRQDMHSYAGA